MAVDGILRFDNVVKSFGGTRALKGVSFDVRRGEVVALLGENGAGKSTLIKVLGGIFRADGGQVSIDGVPYRHRANARGERQRVAFIHQDLGLIEWMTVAENMGLAQGYSGRSWSGRLGLIDWNGTADRAQQALALVGCDVDPTARVHSLSRTEKSWSPSPAPSSSIATSSCSMNPRPAFPPTRSSACSRPFAASRSAESA